MRRALAVLLLSAGCGSHAFDLTLAIASDCSFSIPAGGSLLYEVIVEGSDGGSAPRVCGACIPVTQPISDKNGLVTLLRAAPSCTVTPGSRLHLRLTSFAGEGCSTAAAGPTLGRLCGVSPTTKVGDGHGDQSALAEVSCAAGCDSTTCVAATCLDQGKDCENIGDGCGNSLFCGSCKPPERCGGGGVANVCGK